MPSLFQGLQTKGNGFSLESDDTHLGSHKWSFILIIDNIYGLAIDLADFKISTLMILMFVNNVFVN